MLHSLAVLFGEVVGHRLQALDDPLTDRHTGYHDDELRPAVVLVELVHRLDIGIGLTCTRLHLDAQRQRAMGIAKHTLDRLEILTHLDRADILGQLCIAE